MQLKKLILLLTVVCYVGCRERPKENPIPISKYPITQLYADGSGVWWDDKGDTVCVPSRLSPPPMDNGEYPDSIIRRYRYSPSHPGRLIGDSRYYSAPTAPKVFPLTAANTVDTIYFGDGLATETSLSGTITSLTLTDNAKLKYDTSLFEVKNDSLVHKLPYAEMTNIMMYDAQATKDAERKAWITFFIGAVMGSLVTITVVKIGNK